MIRIGVLTFLASKMVLAAEGDEHAWLTKTFALEWTRLLPGAAMEVIDFVRQTVCYESTQRLKADQVSGDAI